MTQASSNYQAPISDMKFLLFQVFGATQQWQQIEAWADALDETTAVAMLEEAGKLVESQVAPTLRSSDEETAQWHDGKVTTPSGFKQAYDLYCEGGWTGLTGNPEFGGMGMPKAISILVEEMLYAANSSFALYPGLSNGACLAIDAHASEELKQTYLPKMYEGKWSGTMCLTEPQAGSDLGLIRTKAEPQSDGSYAITGTKIFITGGEQDLTENIIHLVLAKLPDAPAGSRGISLFLVPKFLLNEQGELGEANPVSCGSIEHKMGIKASASCVMNFDGAKGFLVGEINRGLNCMFTMMNCERLSIGVQGIGAGDHSYQNAVIYAKERLQGRDKNVQGSAPIIAHPDVRRMLLEMKATTEAGRALAVYVGMQLDLSKYSADEDARSRADSLIALLTPLAKAFFTDMGFENTVLGQQVFGGHGYIREWSQEQLVRDVRIAQIYEGTNGIQAMDLLQRKVFASKGELLELFLGEIETFIEEQQSAELSLYSEPLHKNIALLRDTTRLLIDRGTTNDAELGSAAVEYLHLLGYVTYGYMWLRQLAVALPEKGSSPFFAAKIATADFYFHRMLPRTASLAAALAAGAKDIITFDESYF